MILSQDAELEIRAYIFGGKLPLLWTSVVRVMVSDLLDEIVHLRDVRKKLRQENDDIRQKHNELADANEMLKCQLKDLHADLLEKIKQVSELQTDKELLLQDLSDTQKYKASLEVQTSDLETNYLGLSREHETLIGKFNDQIDANQRLQKLVEVLNEENATLGTRNIHLAAKLRQIGEIVQEG